MNYPLRVPAYTNNPYGLSNYPLRVPAYSTSGAPPLDAFADAIIHAYSTGRQLLSTYTAGNIGIVQPTPSGSPATIPINGSVAAIQTAIGTGGGDWTTIFDQKSSNNLIQNTSTLRPRAGNAGVVDTDFNGNPVAYSYGDDARYFAHTSPVTGLIAMLMIARSRTGTGTISDAWYINRNPVPPSQPEFGLVYNIIGTVVNRVWSVPETLRTAFIRNGVALDLSTTTGVNANFNQPGGIFYDTLPFVQYEEWTAAISPAHLSVLGDSASPSASIPGNMVELVHLNRKLTPAELDAYEASAAATYGVTIA